MWTGFFDISCCIDHKFERTDSTCHFTPMSPTVNSRFAASCVDQELLTKSVKVIGHAPVECRADGRTPRSKHVRNCIAEEP